MAAPSFRAAGTQINGSSVTSISVPAPAAHQAGDLLILVAAPYVTTISPSPPSGWTLLPSGDSGTWTGPAGYRTYIYWKFATSSAEPNVTVALNISNYVNGQMFAIQGDIDPATPIDVSAGYGAIDTDTTIPAPAITTVTNNALVVYIGQDQGANAWNTPPAGATERAESTVHITKTTWADLTKTPAGTVATSDYTRGGTSGSARIFAFAVRPLTAVPPAYSSYSIGTPEEVLRTASSVSPPEGSVGKSAVAAPYPWKGGSAPVVAQTEGQLFPPGR